MIVTTAIFAAGLALILGIALCVFRSVFHVETDVLVALIRETLPGANCGACGFPGCDGFASACATKETSADKCTVSDAENTKKRASLVGGSADIKPTVAIVACRGTEDCAVKSGIYTGLKTCRGAKIASGGTKVCKWGCIGFGDCVNVCNFGAITMNEDGIPVIDRTKCKGCGLCAKECPQTLIRMRGVSDKGAVAFCNNRNTLKPAVKKSCKAGCIKCGLCERACTAGALVIDNGLPLVDYSKCTSCGDCAAKCPQKVLAIL